MKTSSCAMPGDHLPPSAASATSGSSWADSPKGAVTKGTGVKPQAGPGKVYTIWGTSGADLLKPAGLNATIPAWAAGRAGPGCPRRSCSPMQPRAHKAPHVQGDTGHKKHDVGIMKLQDGQRPSACPAQTSRSLASPPSHGGMLCRRDLLHVAFQETWGQGSQALRECE